VALSLEDELTSAFIDGYYAAGKATGYWGRRFLQAVKRNGGLATARRMLLPRNEGQRKGLDALLEANKPKLTVEAIVLQPRFQKLFSVEELKAAQERLGEYGKEIILLQAQRQRLYPDELEPGGTYTEGAKKQVRVNAYERNPKARAACLAQHGYDCSVCGTNFEKRYGPIGKGFIHVHHLKPISLTDGKYKIDPVEDLRPVCPNCHAMLHIGDKVLSIQQLRQLIGAVEASSPSKLSNSH
jgi:5-methylcytosine-specific restriction protein A